MRAPLDKPVAELHRIGKVTAHRLQRLAIETIADLIFYFPFRHEDLSQLLPIGQLQPGLRATVRGTVQQIRNRRSPVRKQLLTEALVADQSGAIKVIWFHQPYLTKVLKSGDEVYLAGKVDADDRYHLQLRNPVYEKFFAHGSTTHTGRIVPMYSLTSGLSQKQLRFLIRQALESVDQVADALPAEIMREHQLMPLVQALQEVHFPTDFSTLSEALRRVKFDELFRFELRVLQARRQQSFARAIPIPLNEQLVSRLIAALPFTPTADQYQAIQEITADLTRSRPMHRLLEGEVGSGKTLVATVALLQAASAGLQAVLMAPTAVLANQHYQTIQPLLQAHGVSVALLTQAQQSVAGTSVTKAQLRKQLASGKISVAIGTHALLQENVVYKNLALVVVDEQHRFGVNQRRTLRERSGNTATNPHLLSMTATPIPRSLALALYGDLDLSVIRQLPKERKSIITELIDPADRDQAYSFIRDEVQSARQVFVICPLIDPSDKLGVKSVTEEYEKLTASIFPDLRVAMLHGKLKANDKERVMQDFADGKTDVLVATSVVEVGVNVPNATVMLIEGAERFGLAQLHQFRGRVGRSSHQAYCFLLPNTTTSDVLGRLRAVVNTQDGFALAEKDLELRGPGQVYGVQQSGWPEFKVAQLTDVEIISDAKKAAGKLLETSADLAAFPDLQAELQAKNQDIHLE